MLRKLVENVLSQSRCDLHVERDVRHAFIALSTQQVDQRTTTRDDASA